MTRYSRDTDFDFVGVGHVKVVAATKKAILIRAEDEQEEWIPRSQISDDGSLDADAQIGDEGELFIAQWLAEEKGLA